jgi:EAL domain-containing protein (putative c-di-GMP-specific phosphodiesterase class I)/GGDEF domain-containing protein
VDSARRTKLGQVLLSVATGGVVLLLGVAAIRSEANVRRLEMRGDAERRLAAVAARLDSELERKRAQLAAIAADGKAADFAALAAGRYAVWRSDGATLEPVAGPALALDGLGGQIAGEAEVSGPTPTSDGRELLSLYVHAAGGRAALLGVSIDVNELWLSSGLLDAVRQGLNVRVTTADDTQRPVYWSSAEEPVDPISADVPLPGWRITAAPESGWRDPAIDWASSLLAGIVALGYGGSYLVLLRRPHAVQGTNAGLQRRLEHKDEDIATLLRSRAELESQLQTSLSLDALTGLANRASFVEHVDAKLAERRRGGGRGVAVITVRFQQLEELSHSLGAATAAKLLSRAADRLQAVTEDAFAARTSDKDLGLCLVAVEQGAEEAMWQRLHGALDAPLEIDGRDVYSTVSLGVARSADGYALGAELLDHASFAAGQGAAAPERWAVFREDVQANRVGLLRLEADLHNAIKNDELRLRFQPIVSTASGAAVGFEALLRWQHPAESLIPPERFIPLAEGSGQMRQISEWVVRQGIAHSKQWLGLREEPVYVSVNLTPRDLSREFCTQLFERLAAAGVPPEALCVEITETAVVRDFRVAARLISELNERGVRVLLDDFGTGYSSLSYLRELPFHAVKIDKSFVQRMGVDARDFGLVRSIVSLVHYLGMQCVAEGIETQEQLDLLAMVDCDYAQGFLFSKPVAAGEVPALLASGAQRSRTAGRRA